jgi:hypothetical protein
MQQAYRDYLDSAQWQTFRSGALQYYHRKCAVCDLDYQKEHLSIQVHHFRYRKYGRSVIGHEHVYFDVCLLCAKHHPKGKLSRESIQLWRKAYRFRRRWQKLFAFLTHRS